MYISEDSKKIIDCSALKLISKFTVRCQEGMIRYTHALVDAQVSQYFEVVAVRLPYN